MQVMYVPTSIQAVFQCWYMIIHVIVVLWELSQDTDNWILSWCVCSMTFKFGWLVSGDAIDVELEKADVYSI